MDELINLGGSVKALGNGKVGGYLVRFSGPDDPDTSAFRDFYTVDTDFGLANNTKSAVLYHHSLDPTIKGRQLGVGDMRVDDVGVWIESQLSLKDKYDHAIYQMAASGKLGWSSGTATHLVTREEVKSGDGRKANRVLTWPLGLDASLTPTPAEPRAVVMSLKSWQDTAPSFKSLLEEMAEGEAAASAKSVYFSDDMASDLSMSAVSSMSDQLMYGVIMPILSGNDYFGSADFLISKDLPVAEKLKMLTDAFNEFRDLSIAAVEAILTSVGPESAAAAVKSIKSSYADPSSDAPRPAQLLAGMELSEFLSVMGPVTETATRRLAWYDDNRSIKQGRPISAANMTAMQSVSGGFADGLAMLNSIITRHGGVVPGSQADDAPLVDPNADSIDSAQLGHADTLDGAIPPVRTTVDDAVMDAYAQSMYLINHAGQITL